MTDVFAIGELDVRDTDDPTCDWCDGPITEPVATVVRTVAGPQLACLDCRREEPWNVLDPEADDEDDSGWSG